MSWFKIKNAGNSLVLTITGGRSSGEGVPIYTKRDQNTDNQLWMWHGDSLQCKHRGYAMELLDEPGKHGENIDANHYDGSNAQCWEYEFTLDGDGILRNLKNKRRIHHSGNEHWELVYVNRKAQKPVEDFEDDDPEDDE